MMRRLSRVMLRAVVPVSMAAFAVTRDGLVSARIWLGAAGAWVAVTLLWDFLVAARVVPQTWSPLWRSERGRRRSDTGRSRGRRELSLLLSNAHTNPRAHANALRPRLRLLAEHHLRIGHGIDLEHEPERAAGLLGDSAWLIDPTVDNRTPAFGEIDRLLDVLLNDRGAERRVSS